MSGLEIAYAEGQLAALARFKAAAPTPTNPVVRRSAVNSGAPGQLPQMLKQPPTPPLDPPTLARQFADVEQNETRVEPRRKLSQATVIDVGMLPHVLGRGALGALGGGLLGASAPSDDHRVRNALIGATLGAGVTGGLSALRRSADNRGAVDALMHKFKLGADNICTSCRKEKHYGSCKRPIAIPLKRADFNTGMTGDDPSAGDNPSTSPHYTSATSSTSALTRAQEGRPADEQASTAFRDLLRARDLMMPDEGGLLTGGLAKVSMFIRTKLREGRGPTTNPYEERAPGPVPVAGRSDDGTSNIWRSFDSTNGDTNIVGGGAGTPAGDPAA